MREDKFILKGHEAVPCRDLLVWGKWIEDAHKSGEQQIGDTRKSGVRVSTVFLGLNHNFGEGPPLLFETMVFGGKWDGEQVRYSTYEAAQAGHAAMVKLVQEAP